jgi:signal transduction histidine kinase
MGIHPAMTTPRSSQPASRKPTVLIVDDEAGPRESLRIVFKDRYNCAVATCGREGIAYARQHPVDAAILDIKMPDVSGVEVLRELKQIDPDIECIMLTGYETVETARAAVHFGAADYLNKPFDVFAMRDLLEKCITRRRQRQAAASRFQQLQQTNAELTRELAQANRAVAASLLSAGVVHEINNPLSIIAGYTQLLGRDLETLANTGQTAAPGIPQRLASIQREIERCRDISRRFLNFSRASASEEIVTVSKLLDDAAALVRAHPANRSAQIVVTDVDLSLRLRVLPTEILQVLINLGINALQAMDGRGSVSFSARQAPAPEAWAFRSEQFNPDLPLVSITVSDTGPGIAPENLQKIFQPYFTTKSDGNGIGLAITCEIIGKHRGLIAVSSQPGQGAAFSLYLPRAA